MCPVPDLGASVCEVDQHQWPRSSRVQACFTTRHGDFNLAPGVGGAPRHALRNRHRLQQGLGLHRPPAWLKQVHGTRIVQAGAEHLARADGSWSRTPGQACVVMMADCLPVLLADRHGTVVAAVHAGWRGLSAGVIEAAVTAMNVAPADLSVWLGPAIGPRAFEVGPEVRAAFVGHDSAHAAAFVAGRGDRWMADLHALARRRLERIGVADVHGRGRCTFTEDRQFYSFRREPAGGGRMAALLWIR